MTLRTLLFLVLFVQGATFLAAHSETNGDRQQDKSYLPCESTFISSSTPTVICKDGYVDDSAFNNTGSEVVGLNYAYIIINNIGDVQVVVTNSIFNFDIMPTGEYQVYGLSYDGTLNVSQGDHISNVSSFASVCSTLSSNSLSISVIQITPPVGNPFQNFCSIDNATVADLFAIGTEIKWYATETSPTSIPSNQFIINGEDYFATQTVGGCESFGRLQVFVNIEDPAPPTGLPTQEFCSIDQPTVADLSATGGSIQWYEEANSLFPLAPSTPLANGEDYFATQIESSCESDTRLSVNAIIQDPDAPTGMSNQEFCSIDNPTVADLMANGQDIVWYEDISTPTSLDLTTPLIDGQSYFSTQTVNGCESDTRFEIIITIIDPAAPTGMATQEFCAIDNPTVADLNAQGTSIQWYSELNSNTPLISTEPLVHGENYFATQTTNACESDTRFEITITIIDPDAPTGTNVQEFCQSDNPTLADLSVNGTDITWYEDTNSLSALNINTTLVNGEDYYATQILDGCESDTRLQVVVDLTPDPNPSLIIVPTDAAICGAGMTNIEINNSETDVQYHLQIYPSGNNVGVPVVGNGGTIALPTGIISTTTSFQVLAINTNNTNCQLLLSSLVEVQVDDNNIDSDAGPNQILCNVNSTNLSANNPQIGNGTWTQLSGPNSAIIVDDELFNTEVLGLVSGVYEFQWEVENGACSGNSAVTDVVEIHIVNLAAISYVTDVTTVNGDDGVIGICWEGGIPPITITWSPQEGTLGTGVSPNCSDYYEISSLTSGTYNIQIEDGNNCSTTLSGVEVLEPDCSDLEIISIYSQDETCPTENNASITIEVGNATGEITYDIGNGVVPVNTTNTDYTFNNLEAGNYEVLITDERGCTTSGTGGIVVIDEPDTLSITLTEANPSTVGGTDGTVCISISGGLSPFSFSTSCGLPIMGAGICGGDYYITDLAAGACNIMVTDANGCVVSELALLNDPTCDDFEILDVVAENVLCYNENNGSIFISLNGGQTPYQYSIDGGNTFVTDANASYMFSDLEIGTYEIQVIDNSNCSLDYGAVVSISEPDSLMLTISSSANSCEGMDNGNIAIEVVGGMPPYEFLWSDGSTDSVRVDLQPDTYVLTVTDANGCENMASEIVDEIPAFSVGIEMNGTTEENRPVFEGETIELSVITDATNPTYQWSPSDGLSSTTDQTVTASPEETTIYAVLVTSEDGCAMLQEVEIEVTIKNIFLVPNTFTPNFDNNNDEFYPIIEGNVVVQSFMVYNRWGQKIFDDPSTPWDGTYKGKQQPLDTYVYVIQYQIENETPQVVSGDIVLMR